MASSEKPPNISKTKQPHFDANEPRYKCLCGQMHVLAGAQLIAILDVLGVTMNFIGAMANGHFFGPFLSFTVTMGVAMAVLYGLRKEKATYLMPFMVLQVFGGVAMFVMCFVALVAMATGDSSIDLTYQGWSSTDVAKSEVRGVALAIFMTCAAVLAFQIWFFMVILAAYHCLRAKSYSQNGARHTFTNYGSETNNSAQPIGPYTVTSGQQMYPPPQAPPPPYDAGDVSQSESEEPQFGWNKDVEHGVF